MNEKEESDFKNNVYLSERYVKNVGIIGLARGCKQSQRNISLEAEGFEKISFLDYVRAIVEGSTLGRNHKLAFEQVYLKEGILYNPGAEIEIYWLRDSVLNNSNNNYLLLKNIEDGCALDSKTFDEYYLEHFISSFTVKDYLLNLNEGTDYIGIDATKPIRRENLNKDVRTRWLFQNNEEMLDKYQHYLLKNNISKFYIYNEFSGTGYAGILEERSIRLHFLSSEKGPFVKQGEYLPDGSKKTGVHSIGFYATNSGYSSAGIKCIMSLNDVSKYISEMSDEVLEVVKNDFKVYPEVMEIFERSKSKIKFSKNLLRGGQ